MKKIIILLFTTLLLANCSTYKPVVNFETSDNVEDNAKYWKNLSACNFIFDQNTGALAVFPDKKGFITKCMGDYGYSVLR